MVEAKRWHVEIFIDEHDDRTRATARLQTGDETHLTDVGLARCNPDDTNVPEIGDELAVSRALSRLAHKLLDAVTEDIEAVTHRPAKLSR